MLENTRKTFLRLAGLAALVLTAGLAGCISQSPELTTVYDPGDGLRTDLITDNPLESDSPGREMIWLNASRVFTSGRRYAYYLEVLYAARMETGYLDIPPGRSLRLEMDGRTLEFAGLGSRQQRRSGKGLVNETAIYRVQADDLTAIAAARDVAVTITGNKGVVTRHFTPSNSDRFKKFVEKFVTEPSRSPAKQRHDP
jgi:hypothetical protein